jgi:hypothetical protein
MEIQSETSSIKKNLSPRTRRASQRYIVGGTFETIQEVLAAAHADTLDLECKLDECYAKGDDEPWMIIVSWFDDEDEIHLSTMGAAPNIPSMIPELNRILCDITDACTVYRRPNIRIVSLENLADELDQEKERAP